jgi:hypothetical protein
LKEEALDRTMWRARFGRGFGPVVKTDYMTMTVTPNIYRKTCTHIRKYCYTVLILTTRILMLHS